MIEQITSLADIQQYGSHGAACGGSTTSPHV